MAGIDCSQCGDVRGSAPAMCVNGKASFCGAQHLAPRGRRRSATASQGGVWQPLPPLPTAEQARATHSLLPKAQTLGRLVVGTVSERAKCKPAACHRHLMDTEGWEEPGWQVHLPQQAHPAQYKWTTGSRRPKDPGAGRRTQATSPSVGPTGAQYGESPKDTPRPGVKRWGQPWYCAGSGMQLL